MLETFAHLIFAQVTIATFSKKLKTMMEDSTLDITIRQFYQPVDIRVTWN